MAQAAGREVATPRSPRRRNREKERVARKEWRLANKERLAEYDRLRYVEKKHADPEAFRAAQRIKQNRWNAENRERQSEYWRNYRRKKKEAGTPVRPARNPGKQTVNSRRQGFKYKVRALLMVGSEPRCARCGTEDLRVLVLNHVNGGGHAERQAIKGSMYQAIASGRRSTEGLEVACHNCNILHEYERGTRALPDTWQSILAAERSRLAGAR